MGRDFVLGQRRGPWHICKHSALKRVYKECKLPKAVLEICPFARSPPPPWGAFNWGAGNGAPPPFKSSLYAIIYDPRPEMKHIPKVNDAAPLNDRFKELIRRVIFVSINHGCFAKLGPLQGFNFFTNIH